MPCDWKWLPFANSEIKGNRQCWLVCLSVCLAYNNRPEEEVEIRPRIRPNSFVRYLATIACDQIFFGLSPRPRHTSVHARAYVRTYAWMTDARGPNQADDISLLLCAFFCRILPGLDINYCSICVVGVSTPTPLCLNISS